MVGIKRTCEMCDSLAQYVVWRRNTDQVNFYCEQHFDSIHLLIEDTMIDLKTSDTMRLRYLKVIEILLDYIHDYDRNWSDTNTLHFWEDNAVIKQQQALQEIIHHCKKLLALLEAYR